MDDHRSHPDDGLPAICKSPGFSKAGAILPYQKPMQYFGEYPTDTLIIKVYPEKQSSYTLLEDDGKSFDFEKGKFGSTRFECNEGADKTELIIQPTEGKYEGIIGSRAYQIEVFTKKETKLVLINGQKSDQWTIDQSGKLIIHLARQNVSQKQVVTLL
jgi:alpha-glucosidase (family GH31 glycosyl hydrolase)